VRNPRKPTIATTSTATVTFTALENVAGLAGGCGAEGNGGGMTGGLPEPGRFGGSGGGGI
jgi:hypothetical protein